MVDYSRQSDGTVLERHPDRVIRQRPWSQGFDCAWAPDGAYPAWRPFVADIPLLGPDAAPLAECPEPYRVLYWEIPYYIRRLAEPYRGWQWLALEAMRQVEGFEEFLAQEAAARGPNFMLAVWSLAQAGGRAPAERIDLARRAMVTPRVRLLAALSGLPDFDSFCLRAVMAAPVRDVGGDFITDLVGLLAEPRARQALQSTPPPNHWDIRSLKRLPPWLLCHPLAVIVIREKVGPRTVSDALSQAVLGCFPEERQRIAQAMAMVTSWEQAASLLRRWDERLNRGKAFPPPPISGDRLLQPLRNPGELLAEGRAMMHCVGNAGYADHVFNGRLYIYRWLGAQRATVQLEPAASGGWRLTQILGAQNAPVSAETYAAVGALIARQSKPPGLLLETYIAGTLYHGYKQLAGKLKAGDTLTLRREPGNIYDKKALEVLGPGGVKLGYVPAAVNAGLSGRLEKGEQLSTRVIWIDPQCTWRIHISVAEPAARAA